MKEGNMERTRLLELAIEELERNRREIEAEIESLRADLGAENRPQKKLAAVSRQSVAVENSDDAGRRRPKTAAEKRAQSEKMKKIWASRRKKSGVKAKSGRVGSNAISEAMRVYWAKRKAAEKKNAAAKNAEKKAAE